MEKRWAQAPAARHQQILLPQSLDDAVGSGHVIRTVERCLLELEWSAWEARYDGHRGQPAIHPMRLAGAILYGLMRGLRSSRELEDATRERLDFRWFLEGRTVDHSTFADFRVRFGAELKDLFRQIARRVCAREERSVLELVIDGTRIRANSDRHGARTAEGLERLIGACVAELSRKLERLEQTDRMQEESEEEVERLRGEVARLEAQVAQYQRALEVAHVRDEIKRTMGGSSGHPVRVPVTDPDSMIVPNKEGGFSPNYTPTVAVDSGSGAILCADVLKGSDENTAVLPALAEAELVIGVKPGRVLADTGFACGENLEQVEAQGIEAYMPTDTDLGTDNPANRPDPTAPVPEAQWAALPRRGKHLARSAFVYDAQADEYRCPMGVALPAVRESKTPRSGVACTKYQCPGNAGCPLGAHCVKGKGGFRLVVRDVYQPVREKVGRRMATEQGRSVYRSRAPVVEGTFARIKSGMGIRRFLLRGLHQVRSEWNWICAAYNLKSLMRKKTQTLQQNTRGSLFQTARNGTSSLRKGLEGYFAKKTIVLMACAKN